LLGGVKIVVREADAERARRLLSEAPIAEAAPEPSVESIEEEVVICPACGSANVHYEKYNYRLFFLSMLLFSLPLPFKKGEWVCDDCGYRWKENASFVNHFA